jgi:hypothetical protein
MSVISYIHETTILPADLYGCEIWSATLKEEHTKEGAEENVST